MAESSLVGHFFHTCEPGKASFAVQHQGFIESEVRPGVFLVHLFSFIDGEALPSEMWPTERLDGARFYNSAEHMNELYALSQSRVR